MAATIAFACHWCGEQNTVGWERGGKPCLCQHCGRLIDAPIVRAGEIGATLDAGQTDLPGEPPPAPSAIKFRCSQCRHLHRVDPELSGEAIPCEKCGSKLRVPPPKWLPNAGVVPPKTPRPAAVPKPRPAVTRAPSPRPVPAPAPAPAPPVPAVAPAPAAIDRFDLDEPASAAPLPPLWRPGPKPDSVLMPATATSPGPVESPAPVSVKKRKTKKRKRSIEAESRVEIEAVGPILAIIGLVTIVAAFIPESRIPIGIIVSLIGLIIAAISVCRLYRIAWDVSSLQFLLCFFVPFYMLMFVIMFWEETKHQFAMNVLGIVLLLGGYGFMFWGVLDMARRQKEQAWLEERPPAIAVSDPAAMPRPMGWSSQALADLA